VSLQNAVQQRRPDPEPLDWKEYCEGHDAPYMHILGERPNQSRRRLNWFNWFAALTAILALVELLWEAYG
jgi:hypothetical protein